MQPRDEEDYLYHVKEIISGVPFTSLLPIAIECAKSLAIPAWEAFAPNDRSLHTALNDVCGMRDGVTSRDEVVKWRPVLRKCVVQASSASNKNDAAFNASYSASAVTSLVLLATVDDQTEGVKDIQKEHEDLFAEVVAYSLVASLCDENERQRQLETIEKMIR